MNKNTRQKFENGGNCGKLEDYERIRNTCMDERIRNTCMDGRIRKVCMDGRIMKICMDERIRNTFMDEMKLGTMYGWED